MLDVGQDNLASMKMATIMIFLRRKVHGDTRMEDALVTRRRFMLAALVYSTLAIGGGAWLRGSAAWARAANGEAMARFARLLFPHEGLPDEVYAEVMDRVLSGFEADPVSAGFLNTAESALDAQQEKSWFDLEEAEQIAAIRNIQGEPFFARILATVRGAFYTDPAVWKQINYPGASKEYGGYKLRGFNDIDWLPSDDQ
ncbi:MAG: hypothetical protein ACR2QV_04050 [Gammaproteobacteria bacterium]